MSAKALPNVTYVANWLSPVGALAGALRALRIDIPAPPYLSGLSGHAFQLALTAGPGGVLRPAPATGGSYERAVRHYTNLGLQTEILWADSSDRATVEAALTAIRRSIERGRPAIAFGLHLSEFGLVRGYDDDRHHLIVSTLTTEQHGTRLPYALWPPPTIAEPCPVILIERNGRFDRKKAETEAIRFAIAEADAVPGAREVAVGLAAYARWRELLLTPDEWIDARGNAYTIQVTLAARQEAARFLEIVADERGGVSSGDLRLAAAAYREESLIWSKLSSLFPYPHGGDIANMRVREQGARYLEAALQHERAEVDALRRVAHLSADR